MTYPTPSAPRPSPPGHAPSGRRIAAGIVQLAAGLLLAIAAASLWSASESASQTRRDPAPRLRHADRESMQTVTTGLIVAALVQLALVPGVWLGWRPAVVASMVAAGLLALWDLFAALSQVAFAGRGGPNVLGIGLAGVSLLAHAALFVMLLEALRQTKRAPTHARDVVMTPRGAVAVPDAPARGRAGWSQVAAGLLLLLAAGFFAVRFYRHVDSDHSYVAPFRGEMKLATLTSVVALVAAAAQLALAPRVGAGSRAAAVASVVISVTLAGLNALVLVVLLAGGGGLRRALFHASGVNSVFIAKPVFFLAADVLLCVFLLQVLRRTAGRASAAGFPLDLPPGRSR